MSAILFSVATALFGAVVAHMFQTRGWVFQQKRRIHEERVAASTKAAERLTHTFYCRLARSEALLAALRSEDACLIAECLKSYRVLVEDFNVTYREVFPVLVREYQDGFTVLRTIEDNVIGPLVQAGAELEKLATVSDLSPKIAGKRYRDIRSRLRVISHAVYKISRDLYAHMQMVRDDLFDVSLTEVQEHDLSRLNTWNLLKLLFVRPQPGE